MEKRVVITGMGIWACIGKNTEEVTQSLREGRSGIGLDPARRELGYISSLTGIVEQPNLKGVLDRRKRLCLPQQGEYAYMATAEAMRNAGMDEAYLAANEVGIIYGNDSSAAPVIEGIDIIRARRNTAMVGSGNIFQSRNSTVTMNRSVIFNLRGINLTLSAACASGSHAIGMGYLMIRQGLQERVVCGGAQEVNLYSVGSFDGLGAFSARESDPAAASRPFDKDRDGLVLDISAMLSTAKVRVLTFSSRGMPDGFAITSIVLEVTGSEQLELLMKKLKGIQGVMDVKRPTG